MNLVTRHLTTLTDFSGRENREPFWLWVLALYIGQTVISMVVMFPMQIALQMQMAPQFEAMQKQQEAGTPPDPQKFFALMGPLFTYMMVFSLVLSAVFTALLAAALVRRLHDSGRTGYWALPQLLLSLASLGMMVWVFANIGTWFAHPEAVATTVKDNFAVWATWFMVVWLIGFVMMITLIVFLCLPGTDGPNRYGEDPLAEYRIRQRARRDAAIASMGAVPPETRSPARVVHREP